MNPEVLMFTDPHEQTGSDDDVAVIPVKNRWQKFRMWREDGWWYAIQPLQMDERLFRDSQGYPAEAFASKSGQRVLNELQLAILKAEALS